MSMPGFNAESSLGSSIGRYRATAGFGASGAADVLSMQASSMDLTASPGFGIDLFPPIRCCRYAPMLHRFVCVTRHASPLEHCECICGAFGPVIICSPPVATL
jgi:hypothetical protein